MGSVVAGAGVNPADQHWGFWPLLPLYPYGHRRTLVRELIPGEVWSFEQLQGVLYVAVPIRMTVVRIREGLMLFAPVAATTELLAELKDLEARYGPVRTVVLPTSSGLEHKLPVPAMARAFPNAMVWVTPKQWSFPVSLPLAWLGFPSERLRVLFQQGVPHDEELEWQALGPLNLGLGWFMEAACIHRASGSLLMCDGLVAISEEPPQLFEADPKPLLFHARERGEEPMLDSPERRARGWRRLVLFASYLRPEHLLVPGWPEVFAQSMRPGLRRPDAYFGIYPFRWDESWEEEFRSLVPEGALTIQVAPVLERLVLPRCRQALLTWLRSLADAAEFRWLIPAHYSAPVPCDGEVLRRLASSIESRPWAPDQGSWSTLARIDETLRRLGVVPEDPLAGSS
ncbi:MAG: DUF4336 domain-containing protein [Cyanobacteriota bacterium]|nr:DUF4336 domain-containing protein [Cyanobacteriota bacterium]